MNSVDINFSEFGPPIKLIIIDPKKYKSRFKKPGQLKPGRPAAQPARQHQYSAFEYPNNQQQQHKVPTSIPRATPRQQNLTDKAADKTDSGVVNGGQAPIPNTKSTDATQSRLNGVTTTTAGGKPGSTSTHNQEVLTEEEDIIEEEDKQLQSFLTTEQTTRAGRVSKKTKLFSATGSSGSNGNTNAENSPDGEAPVPPKPKVKKRKPAEAFRCKTCSKYYVGHTKLRLHYKKNPDHKIPPKSTAADTSTAKDPPPTAPSPDIVILKACTSVGVQANLQQQIGSNPDGARDRNDPALLLLNNQHPASVTHPLTLEIDSSEGSIGSMSRRRMLDPITVPLTSRNVMSPGENSMHAAMTTLTMTMGNESELEFRCNAFRHQGTSTDMEGEMVLDRARINNEQTFLPGSEVPEGPALNTVDASHKPAEEEGPISPDDHPTDPVSGEHDYADSDSDRPQELPKITVTSKPIWEYVEDKIISEGINQVLTEISDVAEKLSKIARDKIIPIREEEEERLQSSVPIIQVDNPFLSHLLDLPFGTYIFKEDDDEDSRRVQPPPPSITELSQFSLTGGAEVDIDKFLTPESANSLPHLTNLDFNAICNGGGSSNSNH